MREVALIVCRDPEVLPCVVLSAMGKTTNNLLAAGEAALGCKSTEVDKLPALAAIRELHLTTCGELELPAADVAEVAALLQQLAQLLTGVSLMQELTARTSANLVSFGERLSTRIFAAFLRSQGVAAIQRDAFEFLVSTDVFGDGDILPQSYSNAEVALAEPQGAVAVVTGFLARGVASGAITTLGRGGSDLTATVLGRALGVPEVQVYKDVDGVLTADPRLVTGAVSVPFLTYDEATELAYFGAQVLHPQAMQPAISALTELHVRVLNSYNLASPGTLITRQRDMSDTLLTSVVRKANVTLLDIVSTRSLGQIGFLARVFEVMSHNQISVDVVATSEVSVSLTLDPSKLWSKPIVDTELEFLQAAFAKFATVSVSKRNAVISLIGNVQRSNEILERTFRVFGREAIPVKMISQGASKVNISLLVDDKHGDAAVRALHQEFWGGAHGR